MDLSAADEQPLRKLAERARSGGPAAALVSGLIGAGWLPVLQRAAPCVVARPARLARLNYPTGSSPIRSE